MKLFLEYRFSYLLITLMMTILIAPLINDFAVLSFAFDLSLSSIFVFGCFAISRHKTTPWVALVLSIPMLLSLWFDYFGLSTPQLALIGKASGIAYFALISGTIISFVFSSRRVSWEVISASLVAYLTLGVMWGLFYAVIEIVQPGSFKYPGHFWVHGSSSYVYYSFITLTTVGYGDIVPLSGFARSTALLEGILGQTYMAVLVARLVGMHVATAGMEKN